MKFSKYQGCGNDFILIDGCKNDINIQSEEINLLCNRHFGIGADGLIIIFPSQEADFFMDFYNSDGSKASMCGNGARCAVKFAFDNAYTPKQGSFIAGDGIHKYDILDNDQIEISMSNVENVEIYENVAFLNTGVLHYVKLVDLDLEKTVKNNEKQIVSKLKEEAQKIRHEKDTNVSFVDINKYLLTYERGVEDFTLSCGTATVAATIMLDVLKITKNETKNEINTTGGSLKVKFDKKNNKYKNIKLIGPAIKIFDGVCFLLFLIFQHFIYICFS